MSTALRIATVLAALFGMGHGLVGHYDHGAWFLAAACLMRGMAKDLDE